MYYTCAFRKETKKFATRIKYESLEKLRVNMLYIRTYSNTSINVRGLYKS